MSEHRPAHSVIRGMLSKLEANFGGNLLFPGLDGADSPHEFLIQLGL
jgi:hypothetical protein